MADDLPDLFAAIKQGRIGGFPYDPRATVQSFWDLGRNDLNTIWLHQHVGGFERFVGYYESLWLESGTKGVMSGLGFHPTVVERPRNKGEAIAAVRAAFAQCQFDEQACGLGLRRLRAYRKEWDESQGCGRAGPGMTTPRTGRTRSSTSPAAATRRPRPSRPG